ncbi:hypothetical protein AB0I98_47395 [Streptomyces sp. NPDC050211]|uniref:hypothetical protein n=1 Tax=Streptomyces sp. NPDC050211 TaxID=3154932 RepID=UPI00342BF873
MTTDIDGSALRNWHEDSRQRGHNQLACYPMWRSGSILLSVGPWQSAEVRWRVISAVS